LHATEASGSAKVGRGLLQHALLHRKARLAVVASAFSDVSYLQCTLASGNGLDFTGDLPSMDPNSLLLNMVMKIAVLPIKDSDFPWQC